MAVVDINEVANIVGNSRNAYAILLKYLYLPIWSNWVHTAAGTLPGLVANKKGRRIGGKVALGAVTTQLPQSTNIPFIEGFRLTTPRTGTHIRPELVERAWNTRLRWTGHLERAARMGDQAAWVAPRKKDMADSRQQSAINLAIQLYLGRFYVMGIVSSYVNTTSVVTLYGRNTRTSGATTARNWFKFGAHYLRPGMSVGFIDAAVTGGVAGNPQYTMNSQQNEVKITAVSEASTTAPTITLGPGENSTATTVGGSAAGDLFGSSNLNWEPADGDQIVMYGSRLASITSNGAAGAAQGDYANTNGLADIVTGTTKSTYLYGLDKTAAGNEKLYGKEYANAEVLRTYGEMLLTVALHRSRSEGTGNPVNRTVLNESTLREIANENRGDRRFMPVQTESGFARMSHTADDVTLPYLADWLCPPGCIFGLRTDDWEWYTGTELKPVDENPERFIPDYDAHEIALVESGAEACEAPTNQFILDDLSFDQFAPPVGAAP